MTATRRYCSDVPVLLQVRALVDHFREYGKPTVGALDVALARVGRDNSPELFFSLMEEGLITRWACRRFVGDVWSACDHPENAVEKELWLAAFGWAGYTVDGRGAERPDAPLVLYRGASFERRYGMSWTDDIKVAHFFAKEWRVARAHPGVVWTATVEPWRLLAHNAKQREGEPEYVIDTSGLAVSEYVPVVAAP